MVLTDFHLQDLQAFFAAWQIIGLELLVAAAADLTFAYILTTNALLFLLAIVPELGLAMGTFVVVCESMFQSSP